MASIKFSLSDPSLSLAIKDHDWRKLFEPFMTDAVATQFLSLKEVEENRRLSLKKLKSQKSTLRQQSLPNERPIVSQFYYFLRGMCFELGVGLNKPDPVRSYQSYLQGFEDEQDSLCAYKLAIILTNKSNKASIKVDVKKGLFYLVMSGCMMENQYQRGVIDVSNEIKRVIDLFEEGKKLGEQLIEKYGGEYFSEEQKSIYENIYKLKFNCHQAEESYSLLVKQISQYSQSKGDYKSLHLIIMMIYIYNPMIQDKNLKTIIDTGISATKQCLLNFLTQQKQNMINMSNIQKDHQLFYYARLLFFELYSFLKYFIQQDKQEIYVILFQIIQSMYKLKNLYSSNSLHFSIVLRIISEMYEKGLGVPQNYKMALELIEEELSNKKEEEELYAYPNYAAAKLKRKINEYNEKDIAEQFQKSYEQFERRLQKSQGNQVSNLVYLYFLGRIAIIQFKDKLDSQKRFEEGMNLYLQEKERFKRVATFQFEITYIKLEKKIRNQQAQGMLHSSHNNNNNISGFNPKAKEFEMRNGQSYSNQNSDSWQESNIFKKEPIESGFPHSTIVPSQNRKESNNYTNNNLNEQLEDNFNEFPEKKNGVSRLKSNSMKSQLSYEMNLASNIIPISQQQQDINNLIMHPSQQQQQQQYKIFDSSTNQSILSQLQKLPEGNPSLYSDSLQQTKEQLIPKNESRYYLPQSQILQAPKLQNQQFLTPSILQNSQNSSFNKSFQYLNSKASRVPLPITLKSLIEEFMADKHIIDPSKVLILEMLERGSGSITSECLVISDDQRSTISNSFLKESNLNNNVPSQNQIIPQRMELANDDANQLNTSFRSLRFFQKKQRYNKDLENLPSGEGAILKEITVPAEVTKVQCILKQIKEMNSINLICVEQISGYAYQMTSETTLQFYLFYKVMKCNLLSASKTFNLNLFDKLLIADQLMNHVIDTINCSFCLNNSKRNPSSQQSSEYQKQSDSNKQQEKQQLIKLSDIIALKPSNILFQDKNTIFISLSTPNSAVVVNNELEQQEDYVDDSEEQNIKREQLGYTPPELLSQFQESFITPASSLQMNRQMISSPLNSSTKNKKNEKGFQFFQLQPSQKEVEKSASWSLAMLLNLLFFDIDSGSHQFWKESRLYQGFSLIITLPQLQSASKSHNLCKKQSNDFLNSFSDGETYSSFTQIKELVEKMGKYKADQRLPLSEAVDFIQRLYIELKNNKDYAQEMDQKVHQISLPRNGVPLKGVFSSQNTGQSTSSRTLFTLPNQNQNSYINQISPDRLLITTDTTYPISQNQQQLQANQFYSNLKNIQQLQQFQQQQQQHTLTQQQQVSSSSLKQQQVNVNSNISSLSNLDSHLVMNYSKNGQLSNNQINIQQNNNNNGVNSINQSQSNTKWNSPLVTNNYGSQVGYNQNNNLSNIHNQKIMNLQGKINQFGSNHQINRLNNNHFSEFYS